jgi:hypothetical protein
MDRPGANVDWCRVMAGSSVSVTAHSLLGDSTTGRDEPCQADGNANRPSLSTHAEEGEPINDALELATEAHGALDR